MIGTPLCMRCKHFFGKDHPEAPACKAFPNGIPNEIILSRANHRKPFDGDRGILFSDKRNQET